MKKIALIYWPKKGSTEQAALMIAGKFDPGTIDLFTIANINTAEFDELIKVPGIGIKTAQKILELRPFNNVSTLRSIGVIIKRAMPFMELNNIHQTKLSDWIN